MPTRNSMASVCVFGLSSVTRVSSKCRRCRHYHQQQGTSLFRRTLSLGVNFLFDSLRVPFELEFLLLGLFTHRKFLPCCFFVSLAAEKLAPKFFFVLLAFSSSCFFCRPFDDLPRSSEKIRQPQFRMASSTRVAASVVQWSMIFSINFAFFACLLTDDSPMAIISVWYEGNFNFKVGSENRFALDLFLGRLLLHVSKRRRRGKR